MSSCVFCYRQIKEHLYDAAKRAEKNGDWAGFENYFKTNECSDYSWLRALSDLYEEWARGDCKLTTPLHLLLWEKYGERLEQSSLIKPWTFRQAIAKALKDAQESYDRAIKKEEEPHWNRLAEIIASVYLRDLEMTRECFLHGLRLDILHNALSWQDIVGSYKKELERYVIHADEIITATELKYYDENQEKIKTQRRWFWLNKTDNDCRKFIDDFEQLKDLTVNQRVSWNLRYKQEMSGPAKLIKAVIKPEILAGAILMSCNLKKTSQKPHRRYVVYVYWYNGRFSRNYLEDYSTEFLEGGGAVDLLDIYLNPSYKVRTVLKKGKNRFVL
jgi:hypothetical protein